MTSDESHEWHPAYHSTRFRVASGEPWLAEDFTIITAYATTGEQWSRERERTADLQLRDSLAASDALLGRIAGYDPQSGHAEPGWASRLPVDEAIERGRQFAQDAIFAVTDGALWLHCCRGVRAAIALGPFAERLDTPGAPADC